MGIQISTTQETIFAQHLYDNAADYFPDLLTQEVLVDLANKWIRNNSELYRFKISGGITEHFVYVKVPSLRGASRAIKRPYLIPETTSDQKFQLHYTTLELIQQHFEQLGDQRFGTVRMLDSLPEHDAFIMQEASGEIMRRLLNRASRSSFATAPQQLEKAFNNAGVWLRIFHQEMSPPNNIEIIHDQRSDYVAAIRMFTEYLSGALDDQKIFHQIDSNIEGIAERVLPEQLPLGSRFGDFGLTNILVEADGRVTGIDTMAKWRAPIYEDIAWFLTALKAYNMQSYSQGLAFSPKKIKLLEQQFLTGYFAKDPIPTAEIRLFEILRLLERWSAKVSRNQSMSGPVGSVRSFLVNRFFRKTIGNLLKACEQTT